MSTINKDLLSFDLNFLVAETGKEFVGLTPSGITDKVYMGRFSSLDEGYEVMLNGNEVTIDAKIMINGAAYATLPTKGAVLQDRDGNKYKVMLIERDGFGPSYVLNVAAQYQRA